MQFLTKPIRVASVTTALLLSIAGLAQAATYNIINIPTLDSTHQGGSIYAQGINAGGQVVGTFEETTPTWGTVHFAFTAQVSGNSVIATNLGYLFNPGQPWAGTNLSSADPNYGSWSSFGLAINSSGTVAGISSIGGFPTVMQYSNGVMVDDGLLPNTAVIGQKFSNFGAAINDNGVIAGGSIQNSNRRREHAFVYAQGATANDPGVYTDLSSGEAFTSAAYGISADGKTAVGFANNVLNSEFATNFKSATKWTLSGSTWTPTTLELATDSAESVAFGINNAGQIVGTDGAAVLYQPDGTVVKLTSDPVSVLGDPITVSLAGYTSMALNQALAANSCADAINNHGQIVGYFASSSGKHAFIATVDSHNAVTLTDLNTLIPPGTGWELTEATAINDAGQIVGYGTDIDDNTIAFVLVPISQGGACCNGTHCTLVATSTACTGAYQGDNSVCGTPTNPTTCCPANFDGTGGVNVNDIFAFLRAWFAHDVRADFDHTGAVNVNDIFAFLRAWFAKC